MGINFGDMSNTTPATPGSFAEVDTGHGIVLDLNKGDILDLTKREPGLCKLIVGAGWDANTAVPAFDLDVSAFLLNSNMKISSKNDIVFFNNMSVPGVSLSGDNTTGSGEGDDEQIMVDLSALRPDVQAIDFVINIFEAQQRRQTFGMVQNSYIRILNHEKGDAEILRYRLKEDFGTATAVIAARLVKVGTEWRFEATGEGKVVSDLNGIAALYL